MTIEIVVSGEKTHIFSDVHSVCFGIGGKHEFCNHVLVGWEKALDGLEVMGMATFPALDKVVVYTHKMPKV